MMPNKNVANAVGGKTARSCDSCIGKRARWYCPADDAFVCRSCDLSLHSDKSSARRYERIRLKSASLKSLHVVSKDVNYVRSVPSWHQGFKRKTRTPRNGHGCKPLLSLSKIEEKSSNLIPFVPEVDSDDQSSHEDNNEEHLLYRVPISDPFVAELCTPTTISNEANHISETIAAAASVSCGVGNGDAGQTVADASGIESMTSCFHGFLPSEMELAEFAADVKSLLGRGLENEPFGMEDLGFVDCKEEKQLKIEFSLRNGKVKLEDEGKEEEEKEGEVRGCHDDDDIDMAEEPPFQLSLEYDPATCEDEKPVTGQGELKDNKEETGDEAEKKKSINYKNRKIKLSLNYEAVIRAWASHYTSPWTKGDRPDVDPDCWPECMGIFGAEVHHQTFGDTNGVKGGKPAMAGGGREARVSRYREKRRTRMFSKTIRYEVRKLNAEKRPRIKGRFVKRATFLARGAPAFPLRIN